MLLSYRNDITPAKSAGVGFRSPGHSIAVTLTYLHKFYEIETLDDKFYWQNVVKAIKSSSSKMENVTKQ